MFRRRLPLSIALVTLLGLFLAAPAAAQSTAEEDTGTTTVVSVEGTVLESDTTSALVRTDDGDMRFVVRNSEHRPEYLAPGTRVRIWYRGTADTEFRATRIVPSDATGTEPASGDMDESSDGAEDAGMSPEAEADGPRETDAAEEESASSESLPQTAGWLPLAAVFGIVALAAGLGLRADRRRS